MQKLKHREIEEARTAPNSFMVVWASVNNLLANRGAPEALWGDFHRAWHDHSMRDVAEIADYVQEQRGEK